MTFEISLPHILAPSKFVATASYTPSLTKPKKNRMFSF
jgi:hypothetical protein